MVLPVRPSSYDLTRWSGLWTEDLARKPWGDHFSHFARAITQSPDRPRSFHPFNHPFWIAKPSSPIPGRWKGLGEVPWGLKLQQGQCLLTV
jgi:hypothetical protein